jgi:hypothetical protein
LKPDCAACNEQENDCPLVGAKGGQKRVGPLLGNKSPEWRVSIVSVVFTPTRGVIHPSFPLRGRWERTLKSGEQAPSPSLITRLDSSSKTRQRLGHIARVAPRLFHSIQDIKGSGMCNLTCLAAPEAAPNRSWRFNLELFQGYPSEIRRNGLWKSVTAVTEARKHSRRARAGSRTTVTKFTAIRRYRFFARGARECPLCAGSTPHTLRRKNYFGDCCYWGVRCW